MHHIFVKNNQIINDSILINCKDDSENFNHLKLSLRVNLLSLNNGSKSTWFLLFSFTSASMTNELIDKKNKQSVKSKKHLFTRKIQIKMTTYFIICN